MKRTSVLIISILAVLAFAISACASTATQAPMEAMDYAAAPEMAREPVSEEMASSGLGFPGTTAQSETRLVIRNANLSIVVADPVGALDVIASLADEMGGFVVTSNLYKTTTSQGLEIPQADITIRVPAEKLEEVMNTIKGLVDDPTVDILSENISGQDVTQDYTDTKSRLANLESAEKQLQNIMDSATKTEDVLAVYNQLVQVREQIEVLKGQIKYYEESAALSALNVNLRAQASVQPIVIGGWRPAGIAKNAIQALIDTMQFLGSALIWIIIFVIPIGVILVVFFLFLRFIWRKIFKPKPRAPRTPPVQPPQNPDAQI